MAPKGASLRFYALVEIATLRGKISILDRAGLEKVSCPCYEEIYRQDIQLLIKMRPMRP
jgi:hypothetical protein